MLADESSLKVPPDQLTLIDARMHEILITGGTFDAIYRHVLAAPGKRVRASMVLACTRLLPSTAAVPLDDAVDLACTMEMLHEASLMHDDICDGSLLRRGAASVPAAFGIRTALGGATSVIIPHSIRFAGLCRRWSDFCGGTAGAIARAPTSPSHPVR